MSEERELGEALDARASLEGGLRQAVDSLRADISSIRAEVSRIKADMTSLKKTSREPPAHDHKREYVLQSALVDLVTRTEWAKWSKGIVNALDVARADLVALKEEKVRAAQFVGKKTVEEFAKGVGERFRGVDKELERVDAIVARMKEMEKFLLANVKWGKLKIPEEDRAIRQRNPSASGRRGQTRGQAA